MAEMATPQRSCGPCTFCCKVMSIDELAKPVGTWCEHCTPGRGCAIYGQHPQSCRDFACQWLLEPDMPHRYRPDQSKVVLAAEGDGPRLVAHCDPANPTAWRRNPMYALLKQQARATWGTGATVVAKAGLRLWLIAPEQDIDLGEVDPRSPFKIEQTDGGTGKGARKIAWGTVDQVCPASLLALPRSSAARFRTISASRALTSTAAFPTIGLLA
jgi:hypothetical protein